jgi:Cu(I)/Ag(I) efflux system membrane protein CusA/SilA
MKVSTLYKNLERYPISLRFEENQRRSLESIKDIQIKTPFGFLPLNTFADISYRQSASVIKSEKALPVTFISITPRSNITPSEYKQKADELLKELDLENGYYIEWAGQSEYLESAMAKIVWIIPAVLVLILVLIYFALRSVFATTLVFFTLPFALLGGLIYIDVLEYSMSIAVIVGFLALLGIAAETAIVMIVYLEQSVKEYKDKFGKKFNKSHLMDAIYDGAVQRVRPKLMTVFAILAGLLPIMYIDGVGSEVMQRIAAPMIGGIVSSAILSLIIIPIIYESYLKREVEDES